MIVSPKCNFRCSYCDFWNNPGVDFKDISLNEFELVVRYLLKYGNRFKFTGGEPCTNRNLEYLLEIVKSKGGVVYLDSNGSLPNRITTLIEKKLIARCSNTLNIW
ncbi:hypothetical protein TI03_02060 [Achromatium sp. WMS1]|nr:hypothetical protein TI03_02060 [Achromatium sp. WMS1]